jgi:uncharacterized protein YbaP (TraB family)
MLKVGAQDQSLLWKISGNGLEKDSYIFGTIHLLCQDDLDITPTIQEALGNTEQVVLELDFDDPSMMSKLQQLAMLSDGENIRDLVTEEEYASLNTFFQETLGMPLDNLSMMKPFLLMSMIIPSALECMPGSYELTLTKLATEAEMEVLGLETVEEQMGAIDSFSQEDLAEMLLETVENFDETKTEFAEMVSVYKQNDAEALYDLMQESMQETSIENFNEVMLDNRNTVWIERIENYAREKPTFFAVGAGHLGGANGVIALLKSAGYTLTAIK